jgi:hypothetical protein
MKLRNLLVFLLLVSPAFLPLRAKSKKPTVPAVFGSARTAYVESVNGQQFDRDLDAEDREAIADLQDALGAWKRYRLVTQREEADIVFVVRKGIPNPSQRGGGETPGGWSPGRGLPGGDRPQQPMPGDGDLASADMLEVCQVNADGKLTKPLWERTLQEGLNPPQVLLFQQLREEVDKAYPLPPAGGGTKQ